MIVDDLSMSAAAFAAGTGWVIKPEGACRAEVCVPLASGAFDVTATASTLGMAVVHEPRSGHWSIGPASIGGRALTSAQAPDLVLDDLDGNEFRLSSLRGQKVLLVAWAPY